MATNYPGAIDSLTNPASTDPMSSPAHAAQHSNANDAIEAIEAILGASPQSSASTVSARIAGMEAYIPSIAASVAAAALSASQASTSAAAANAYELSASGYSASANTSYIATAALYDLFDDRFLGAKASDPALDNDGNPLVAGTLYFNTVSNVMRVYTGAAWVNAVDTPYNWSGPIAISASSASPALQITQLGTGDVIQLLDESGDTSPFVLMADGAILTYSAVTASGASGRFQGHGAVTQCTSSTRPGSPLEGDIIYETDTDLFYGYNGAAWASIGGGSIAYQASAPTVNLSSGTLWVDSDGAADVVNANDYYTKTLTYAKTETYSQAEVTALVATAGYTPFFLMGA